ncbi:NUMOD4 domain-containing protein [Pseudomonas sp. NBRC 111135]|uniref:NUMOD4 domain-containing protein n=1 Tax=Pseudomonas sp. NBRC 111135 TaxID=1661050 RepID=UPI0006D3BA50|nr:NUMOD4 domain-containing protein [Pseudomonas sp. NBRC 111135]
MQEIWKPIAGFEGLYEISNLGRVKSLGRFRRAKGDAKTWMDERIKAPCAQREGYLSAHLYCEGRMTKRYVHRLVADAFLPNPLDLPEVNHLDGDKQNNSLANLAWSSRSENCRHALESDLYQTARGERAGNSKLSESDVREIRSLAASGMFHREIADQYRIGRKAVTKIVNRQRWEHVS